LDRRVYLRLGCKTWLTFSSLEVFSNLLGTSAASVAIHEEEVRNRKRQEEEAARDREALSAEVAVLAQEASDVAEKLSNFYQLANAVGLGYFEFAISGELVHANVGLPLLPPMFMPKNVLTLNRRRFPTRLVTHEISRMLFPLPSSSMSTD
jgi:hypothetical protein